MSKVYVNQTKLRINFDFETSITGCSSVIINVRQPGGSTTTWTATVNDLASGTAYFENFTTTTLPTKGTYYLQPTTTFSDGTGASCETYKLKVYGEYE
jgi:hypothetical protein